MNARVLEPLSEIELDDEQRDAALADSTERLLVIAGAGRGKTEVVFHRIRHLIEDEGLSPSGEVVVLTFSRAAVDAVRKRLQKATQVDATIRTFDSFATRILLDQDVDLSTTHGFDDRIRRSTAILSDESTEISEVEDIRHLIIDEAQDLVGDRADLVVALLSRLSHEAGFTVLGDSLQGIYDFQLENGVSSTTSADLLAATKNKFDAREIVLTGNYRARGRDPKQVSELGDRLRDRALDDSARLMVDDLLSRLVDLGPFKEALQALQALHADAGPTAVLCRTNADALKSSQFLMADGLVHTVRRPAAELGAHSWLARALAGYAGLDLAEEDALEIFEDVPGAPDPDDAWFALRSAAGRSARKSISMLRLRSVVRARGLPWSLLSSGSSDLVVSTVHRAKGLEFDRVVIVAGSAYFDRDPRETIRLDYVALSRARDDIYLSQAEKAAAGYRRGAGDRWVEQRWWKQRPLPCAIEFKSNDVDDRMPFGNDRGEAQRCQEWLMGPDVVGRRVTARLDEHRSSPSWPVYELRSGDDVGLGLSSEQFGWDFVKTFRRPKGTRSWPKVLNNLMITAVETAAGDPEDTNARDLGPGGFWLVPRVLGLATPQWS